MNEYFKITKQSFKTYIRRMKNFTVFYQVEFLSKSHGLNHGYHGMERIEATTKKILSNLLIFEE